MVPPPHSGELAEWMGIMDGPDGAAFDDMFLGPALGWDYSLSDADQAGGVERESAPAALLTPPQPVCLLGGGGLLGKTRPDPPTRVPMRGLSRVTRRPQALYSSADETDIDSDSDGAARLCALAGVLACPLWAAH